MDARPRRSQSRAHRTRFRRSVRAPHARRHLDNVMLYWLTNTAVSSARLSWESKLAFFAPKGVPIPAAVSVFPDEIYAAPKSWTEKAYPKSICYNRLPKGAHFAAWKQPK